MDVSVAEKTDNIRMVHMKAVKVIDDFKVAKILIDPMRRAILSILADKDMTETQLAEILGLTESAVGHHLRILEKTELVKLVRREPDPHGILQKFYRSGALYFAIDTRRMPREISRYFFPVNIERVRGVLSSLQILTKQKGQLSSEMVEYLSKFFTESIIEVAKNYVEQDVSAMDRETFIVKLYSEALLRMSQQKEKTLPPPLEMLSRLVSVKIR